MWVSVDFCETWPTDHWFGSGQHRGHVMTLVGFDSNSSSFLVSDPNDRGKYWVSWLTFASSWDVLRQAVAVS